MWTAASACSRSDRRRPQGIDGRCARSRRAVDPARWLTRPGRPLARRPWHVGTPPEPGVRDGGRSLVKLPFAVADAAVAVLAGAGDAARRGAGARRPRRASRSTTTRPPPAVDHGDDGPCRSSTFGVCPAWILPCSAALAPDATMSPPPPSRSRSCPPRPPHGVGVVHRRRPAPSVLAPDDHRGGGHGTAAVDGSAHDRPAHDGVADDRAPTTAPRHRPRPADDRAADDRAADDRPTDDRPHRRPPRPRPPRHDRPAHDRAADGPTRRGLTPAPWSRRLPIPVGAVREPGRARPAGTARPGARGRRPTRWPGPPCRPTPPPCSRTRPLPTASPPSRRRPPPAGRRRRTGPRAPTPRPRGPPATATSARAHAGPGGARPGRHRRRARWRWRSAGGRGPSPAGAPPFLRAVRLSSAQPFPARRPTHVGWSARASSSLSPAESP